MNLNFFKSQACLSRAHCKLCRSKTSAGEQWRKSVAQVFALNGNEWDCPYGVDWGEEAAEVVKQVCKFMRDTGVLHRKCCGNYIVCDNPESPIFIDRLRIESGIPAEEFPRVWWSSKCRPNRCKFFTLGNDNAD